MVVFIDEEVEDDGVDMVTGCNNNDIMIMTMISWYISITTVLPLVKLMVMTMIYLPGHHADIENRMITAREVGDHKKVFMLVS